MIDVLVQWFVAHSRPIKERSVWIKMPQVPREGEAIWVPLSDDPEDTLAMWVKSVGWSDDNPEHNSDGQGWHAELWMHDAVK